MKQDGMGAYEDQPWNAEILSKAKKIAYLDKHLYFYRIDATDSSTNNGKIGLINYIKRRNQAREILIENNCFNDEIKEFTTESVSNIIAKGGTILKSARSKAFMTPEGRKQAYEVMQQEKIDALVVIGGNGSLTGAKIFADEFNVPCIGLPGTIDNDIASTEYTIGYDTAMNTAMDAIDKLRDTASSHERCSVIEVMGRHAGYIALNVGIATGAECILIPEVDYDFDRDVIRTILDGRNKGKRHYIVIVAEGVGSSASIASRIEEVTGIEARPTILGHLQRGGSPTLRDRTMASLMGVHAIECIKEGRFNRLVVQKSGAITDVDIEEGLSMKKTISQEEIEAAKLLS